MAEALELFNRTFPYLWIISSIVEKEVYDLITKGLPLSVNTTLLDDNTPFLKQLCEATGCDGSVAGLDIPTDVALGQDTQV
jgi:hypothetical protein